MRRIVPALVLMMAAVALAACGDDEGSGTTGGTTSGTTSTDTGTGGGGTGGAPGTGGGGGGGMAECTDGGPMYLQACTADADCAGCGTCFTYNNGMMLCTLQCAADADCPPPSSGCSNMGVCKQM